LKIENVCLVKIIKLHKVAKIIFSFIFFVITIITLGIEVGGSQGHIMFRPWMIEDWIIWGVLIFCPIISIILIYTIFNTNREPKNNR